MSKPGSVETATEFTSQLFELVEAALNSGFSTALLGAFFGALAANYFAIRSETKSRLTTQLLACNEATSYSIAVFQHSLNMKRQFVVPLIAQFQEDKVRFEEQIASHATGKDIQPSQFDLDFFNYSTFTHNAEKIEQIVCSNGIVVDQTITATSFLVQSLQNLDTSFEERSKQLSFLEGLKKEESPVVVISRYFGVSLDDRVVDTRLADSIGNMSDSLDDAIFYSKYIAERTSKRSQELAKQIGKASPQPLLFSFDDNEFGHLVPTSDNFPTF
ncbi:hypothetical protein NBRC116594_06020 [Shimia sp. NS0008-38b]|uniref:hypothetical protein n=1 Tax=Shimia sp. NS0008-38b TaxID=3127653 RepID=UPI00310630C0